MQAARFHEYGEPEVLQVEEIERPEPSDNEILVEIEAASVNPIDAMLRSGIRGVPTPMIAGSDFAGTVAGVGQAVTAFEVGDRVFGAGLHPGFTRQGTYATYTCARTDLVAKLPADVPFDVAAATGTVGVTAWRGLIDRAGLRPTESCFVHGGAGGVGHVAVQLASSMGATVVATGGSTEHRARIVEFGANEVLQYDDDGLREAASEATGGGADVVLDHRLHDYHQFDVDIAALGGRIVVIGGGTGELSNAAAARARELTVHHLSMTNMATYDDLPNIRPILRRLARLMAAGDVRASIADRYSLVEAAEAQRSVMEDSFVGKLVIEP